MPALLANNATSTLASGITAAATSLTLASGTGAKFPSPTNGDWFPLTLDNGTAIEICRCTARIGDTLTVQRAQEGTTAAAFLAGAKAELRLTAGTLASTSASRVIFAGTVENDIPAVGWIDAVCASGIGSRVIPANTLAPGRVIRVKLWYYAVGYGTTEFRARLGSTVVTQEIVASGGTADTAVGCVEVECVVAEAGATGSVIAYIGADSRGKAYAQSGCSPVSVNTTQGLAVAAQVRLTGCPNIYIRAEVVELL